MYLRYLVALACIWIVFFVAPAAHAATFCVGSANALQTALATAATNSSNNTIQVQAGTYLSPQNGFIYSRTGGTFSLDVEGGWNAGCTTQTPDASLTVLDGNMQQVIMSLSDATDPGSDITVRYIGFLHGLSSSGGVPALGAQAPGTLRVENCRFRLNNVTSTNANTIYLAARRGPVYFLNNIVANNSALTSAQIIHFDLGSGGANGVQVYINGNTFADNAFDTTASSSGTLSFYPFLQISLANNILWGNGGNEFAQNIPITPMMSNNDVDVLNVTPAAGSSGNLNVDPLFVNVNNHHLQQTTPLYNAGQITPAGGVGSYDLDGNLRIGFGAPDIGAYELQAEPDEIFVDGFDGA
jgi:hypothetical protein